MIINFFNWNFIKVLAIVIVAGFIWGALKSRKKNKENNIDGTYIYRDKYHETIIIINDNHWRIAAKAIQGEGDIIYLSLFNDFPQTNSGEVKRKDLYDCTGGKVGYLNGKHIYYNFGYLTLTFRKK